MVTLKVLCFFLPERDSSKRVWCKWKEDEGLRCCNTSSGNLDRIIITLCCVGPLEAFDVVIINCFYLLNWFLGRMHYVLPPFPNISLFRHFKWTTTYGCM